MATVIVPVAKALYLCEEVDEEGGLTNLYGFFSRLRAAAFPYRRGEFCVFAQLVGGLGEMSVGVEIRRAADGRLVHPTDPQRIRFERRTQLLRVAFTITGLEFDRPGVYLAEMYCNNVWVADTSFEVVEVSS